MRVAPGQPIPFWLRLWDGNTNRYILAHVSSQAGVEQPGSPYLLTSQPRGIYTGLGSVVGTSDLVVDYEVYLDSGLTQLDLRHLGNTERIEADISNREVLATLLSKIAGISPETITAFMDSPVLSGKIIPAEESIGIIDQTGSVTALENTTEDGVVDVGNVIEGELT